MITLAKEPTVANKRLAFNRLRDREGRRQALRRNRPALCEPSGRLPTSTEDGLPRRRQRPDGHMELTERAAEQAETVEAKEE